MAISNHERVNKAMDLLKAGLGPFAEREFTNAYQAKAASQAALLLGEDRLLANKSVTQWDVAHQSQLKSRYRDFGSSGAAMGSFSPREKVRMRETRSKILYFSFPHPSPLPAGEGILCSKRLKL